jgi:hypothetical protein
MNFTALEIYCKAIWQDIIPNCGSPCHHSMARPRAADERDGLQLEVSCEYIE